MLRMNGRYLLSLAVCLSTWLASPAALQADEADARRILQEMSEYIDGLDGFNFGFDAEHELVSTNGEKFGLRSSGRVVIKRPDRLYIHRHAGFSKFDFLYDGQTLAVQDSASGLRAKEAVPGGIDGLIDELRDTYGRPLPAADLIVSSAYDVLMEDVTEVKDLGLGVVNGVECDHLAFRNAQVDWQIWIARGDAPHPCLMVITTRDIAQAPQYRVAITSWSDDAGEIPAALPGDAFSDTDIGTFAAEAQGFPPNYTLEDTQ